MTDFKFIHGTQFQNLPFILKDETIYKSSDVENAKHIVKDFGGSKYVYGNIVFEDININLFNSGHYFLIVIDDKIMRDQKIIFNTQWLGFPLMDENTSNDSLDKFSELLDNNEKWSHDKKYAFSIWLNPLDSKKLENKKISLIKSIILKKLQNATYFSTHEILFTNEINVELYVPKAIFSNFILYSKSIKTHFFVKMIDKFVKKYKKKHPNFTLNYIESFEFVINKLIFEK